MSISDLSPGLAGGRAAGAGVTAVLGPTNTGKTHLAIERMLAHSSGVIGLPLRLLAREVYNKLVDRAGADSVALVTGEEKIKPPKARFWVSTVEAMPRDLDVSFLAVDEIQIAADLERGHVFTDRILHRRGRDETLILGAATMRGIVERLLPGISIVTRPRLSQLSFSGDRKITRQPRRTAIVAFSADEVYAIAELIRRQRGGAAVVMGSLSPRTRNAQVAMFQSGEVDYLVATDAIGMGLNLDVDHVAFASDRKYDGYQYRRLTPSEFAQIAGRAGRASRDGTFGTTGRCAPFEPELVNALQNHAFESVRLLQWRNSALDFSSLGALQATLAMTPTHEALARAPIAEDIRVLDHAVRDSDIRELARDATAVERLWDVCQIPDYRKIAPAAHAELVTTLFGFLMREGRIPDDWYAAQVAQTDRVDGDIDTLSARIAQIRTWTFAANRPDWLRDPEHWQGVTRAVEDKLSDALHDRLTERFVDRRTSVLMRRLRENAVLTTEISKTGDVVVEGHVIGRLDGFTFAPDAAEAGTEAKALQAASQKALAGEIDARAERLGSAPDSQFVLTADGTMRWVGDAVGKLVSSDNALVPRIRIIADDRLAGASREAVQNRLDLWLKTHIEKLLGPLFEISKAEDITGIARGIAFQLVEALGVLDRQKIAAEIKGLDQPARASLRKYGVRFGAYHIYFPGLLKPAARSLALQLTALMRSDADTASLAGIQQLAGSGRTSFAIDKEIDRDAYRALGYKVCGERAVRVDILERLADLIRAALSWREGSAVPKPAGAFDGRSFTVTQAMTSLVGSTGEDFAVILRSLGYRMDRRPPLPPAPEPAAAIVEEAAAALTEAAEQASPDAPATSEPVAADEVITGLNAEEIAPVADAEALPPSEDVHEAAPAPEASSSAPALETAETSSAAEIPAVTEGTDVATADSAPMMVAEAAAPAAPEPVEVWRPGGRFEDRRPRPERHRHHRHQTHAEAQTTDAADGEKAESGHKEHRRRRRRRGDRPRLDVGAPAPAQDTTEPAVAAASGDGTSSEAPDKQRRDRNEGRRGERHERHRDKRGQQRRERDFTPRPPRERPIDPNSPFAKLAALKEQLESSAKEKR
jgi:ATP-dependent RNA helicase SUPV3L1/SUV3